MDGVSTREIALTAPDGHSLAAWVAMSSITPRAGLVIAQEMYGINDYIRGVCAWYAEHGYLVVAPALYDRIAPGLTFDYTDTGNAQAKAAYRNADWTKALLDLETAREFALRAGKVGLIGFCYGGTLAWMAACRCRFDAAVAYYGGEIPQFQDEMPACPVEMHIGDRDTELTAERIAAFRARHTEVPVHVYEGALHGFDNPGRPPRHHAGAARTARARTLAFLSRHLSR